MVNPIGKELLEALEARYRGEIAQAKANIRVYIENPTGIGEHPEVAQAMDAQIEIIASAQEKLDILLGRKFNFSGERNPVE